MKKNNISLIVIFGVIFGLFMACEDTRYEYITPNKVYISQSGEIEQIIYKTGDPYVFRLGVYKSGYEDKPATVVVSIMSQSDLDFYNTVNNTQYKRFPDNCFKFENNSESKQLNFSKKSRLEYVDIIVDYNAIENLPDYDPERDTQYVIPLRISQADVDVNENKRATFVKVLIKEPLIYFNTLESFVKIESPSNQQYSQIIELAVDFPNVWDISINLAVNPDAVAEYNAKNETNLKLLPSETYTISPNPVVIHNGKNKEKVTVIFDESKIDYDDFLLPLVIESASKFSSDSEREIHLIHVSHPASRLDRKNWTIESCSSEEPIGEGDGNGVASCVLDGNPATYWHSQWYGGTGQLPHYIIIDMQKEVTVAYIDLQRRQNQRDTYRGNFYISSDNVTFTQIGSFEMAEINEPQTFKVMTTKGRYVKIEITESRRPPFANMAEIFIRGIE